VHMDTPEYTPRPRLRRVVTHVDPSTYDTWARYATTLGLSISALLRLSVNERLQNNPRDDDE